MIQALTAVFFAMLGSAYGIYQVHRMRLRIKASAWSEGYWQGVADSETAADVNMPGYGPNRVNPYRDPLEIFPRTYSPLAHGEEPRRLPFKFGIRGPQPRMKPGRGYLPPLHGGYRPRVEGARQPTDPERVPLPPQGKGGGSHPRSDR